MAIGFVGPAFTLYAGLMLAPACVACGFGVALSSGAVSTGSADTLECLMTRIGLPPTEYVAGTGTTGHVHVYSGGNPNGGNALLPTGQYITPTLALGSTYQRLSARRCHS